jgi:DNA-binding transcriptional LysR family regulator
MIESPLRWTCARSSSAANEYSIEYSCPVFLKKTWPYGFSGSKHKLFERGVKMIDAKLRWMLDARFNENQMRLLIALDCFKSLRQAARELSTTQSTLSRRLSALEKYFGVPLFERMAQGITPTKYGATLIRHSRAAVERLLRGREELASLKAGLSGKVSIGVVMEPALTLLPPVIAAVKSTAPDLRIAVHLDVSAVLLNRLRDREIDLMIGHLDHVSDNCDLVYERVSSETICVVAGRQHPLKSDSAISLEEIVTYPWILPTRDSAMRCSFDAMLHRAKLNPSKDVVETNAISVTLALLQQTNSLSLLPLEVARHYRVSELLKVLPVEVPFDSGSFGVIHQARSLTPASALILKEILYAAKHSYGIVTC